MKLNAYEETLRGVQWVLDNCTSYRVAKDLEINNRTINRYQNGESPVENMAAGTLGKLYNYYLKERIEMNIESLEKAIEEFNEWGGTAKIWLDISDGYFNTDVYHNDLQAVESYPSEEFVCVFNKDEIEGSTKIAAKRKDYIIKYARLILDGWEPIQAQRHLN